MNRINHPRASSGGLSFDGLAVEQIRIHLRRLIQEPRLQVLDRVLHVLLLARENVSRPHRPDDLAQSHHGVPMRDEIVRIRHAILLNVGAVRVFRVRPPIVSFGEEIMLPSSATVAMRSRHSLRFRLQILRRLRHDPRPLDLGEVESSLFRCTRAPIARKRDDLCQCHCKSKPLAI